MTNKQPRCKRCDRCITYEDEECTGQKRLCQHCLGEHYLDAYEFTVESNGCTLCMKELKRWQTVDGKTAATGKHCHKCHAKIQARNKAAADRYRAQGHCKCGRPAAENRKSCEPCLAAARAAKKGHRSRRVSKGEMAWVKDHVSKQVRDAYEAANDEDRQLIRKGGVAAVQHLRRRVAQ